MQDVFNRISEFAELTLFKWCKHEGFVRAQTICLMKDAWN